MSQQVVPFFGARREPDGSVGLGCLSQWWHAPTVEQGRRFETAEHWMMWSKAVIFGDAAVADQVLKAPGPREAKALGRRVSGFDPAVWDAHADAVVLAGNLSKFTRHPELAEVLLGTGDALLVEASPWDRIWGAGLAADDPRIHDTRMWPGTNRLGIALMDVRRILRDRAKDQGEFR